MTENTAHKNKKIWLKLSSVKTDLRIKDYHFGLLMSIWNDQMYSTPKFSTSFTKPCISLAVPLFRLHGRGSKGIKLTTSLVRHTFRWGWGAINFASLVKKVLVTITNMYNANMIILFTNVHEYGKTF